MSQLSFDQFLKRMQKADSKLLKELEKELLKSSMRMERDAKLNATTYPKVVTGRLRSSITGLVDSKQGTSRVILRAGGSNNDVNYAGYVEFGTNYIKPRLYLGRAVSGERDRLPDRLGALLNIVLGSN